MTPYLVETHLPGKSKAQAHLSKKRKKDPAGIHLQQVLLTACQRSQNTGWINNAQSKHSFNLAQPTHCQVGEATLLTIIQNDKDPQDPVRIPC